MTAPTFLPPTCPPEGIFLHPEKNRLGKGKDCSERWGTELFLNFPALFA
jgi:hypothetical protein